MNIFYFEALPKIIEHVTHTETLFEKTSIYSTHPTDLQGKILHCRWLKMDGIIVVHKTGEKRGILRAQVLSRLSTPVIVLVEILAADIFQFFRGINTLIGGVVDLDYKKLKIGVIDLLSIPIQTLIFSVFAPLALISPNWTKVACQYMETYSSNTFEIHYKFEISRKIMSVVSGVFLTCAQFPAGIIEGFRYALIDWRWEMATFAFGSSLLSITYVFWSMHGLYNRSTSMMYAEKMWRSTIIAYTEKETPELEKKFSLGKVHCLYTQSS
ncbi:MAG: hypothetical protein KDK55_06470 [Chlamydiia bacterium]|nr:hypothetical protein [Chlamydiia bacterium]